MDPLLPVLSQLAGYTLAVQVNLVPILTLGSALVSCQSLSVPGCQTNSAHVAEELALLHLVSSIATRPAQSSYLVIIPSSWTCLLTITQSGASLILCGTWHTIDLRTNTAGQLSFFSRVEPNGTVATGASVVIIEGPMGTGVTGVVNNNRARGTGEGGGNVNTCTIQECSWQSVVNVQVVFIKNNFLQQSLNLFSSAIVDVDGIFTIKCGEGNFQVIFLINFWSLSLHLVLGFLDTVDIHIKSFAFFFADFVTGRELPFLIQSLQSCDDLLLEHTLASGAAQDLGQVLELDLEYLLSRGSSRAGRIYKLRGWVLVRIWPPETLSSTSVELWHRLGELLAILTFDSANLEYSSWTPVLTTLGASLWRIQGWTEGLDNIDLEGTGGRVASIIIGNVVDLISSPVQSLARRQ